MSEWNKAIAEEYASMEGAYDETETREQLRLALGEVARLEGEMWKGAMQREALEADGGGERMKCGHSVSFRYHHPAVKPHYRCLECDRSPPTAPLDDGGAAIGVAVTFGADVPEHARQTFRDTLQREAEKRGGRVEFEEDGVGHPELLCTGITARWCPLCGTCSCPDFSTDLNTPGCPLHDAASQHAEARPLVDDPAAPD